MPFIIARRKLIAALGATAAWPLAARGQQAERMRRIGVLMAFAEGDQESKLGLAAFVQELRRLGWADGRNLRIDTRWGHPPIQNPCIDCEPRTARG
jgi:putative ABC transport system substrate-binding protein